MSTSSPTDHTRRVPRFQIRPGGVLGLLALLWAAPTIATAVSSIDLARLEPTNLIIGTFVVFDAVIPAVPGESLLTTVSGLAAQPRSEIDLRRLVVAGLLGAIIADSLLYRLSRTVLRRSMADKIRRARRNTTVARSLEVSNQTARMLIMFGRFVPGLRFVPGGDDGPDSPSVSEVSAVRRHRRNVLGAVHLHVQLTRRLDHRGRAAVVDRRIGGGPNDGADLSGRGM